MVAGTNEEMREGGVPNQEGDQGGKGGKVRRRMKTGHPLTHATQPVFSKFSNGFPSHFQGIGLFYLAQSSSHLSLFHFHQKLEEIRG